MNSETTTKNLPRARAQLVAAHIDLANLRWQMIVGFGLACLAALTCELLRPADCIDADRTYLAWAAETVGSAEPLTRVAEAWSTGTPSRDPFTLLSLTTDCLFWQQEASGYILTNFLIHGTVMLLVALVVLELTGLCGNRGGTAGAIWAALLFAVSPYVTTTAFFVNDREALFGALLLLATLFFWLRYKLIQEAWYQRLALLCFILFLGSVALAAPPQVRNQLVLVTNARLETFLISAPGIVYGLSCVLFLVRLAKGWATKEGLLTVVCLAALAALPYIGGSVSAPHLLTCSAIALSMLLPILSLPVMDRIDRRNALLFSAIGTCLLVIIFLLWCTILQVHCPETILETM